MIACACKEKKPCSMRGVPYRQSLGARREKQSEFRTHSLCSTLYGKPARRKTFSHFFSGLRSSGVGIAVSQPPFFSQSGALLQLLPSFPLPSCHLHLFPTSKKTLPSFSQLLPNRNLCKKRERKGRRERETVRLGWGEELKENLYHSENEREREEDLQKSTLFLRKQTGWLVVTQQQKSSSNQMRRNFVLGKPRTNTFPTSPQCV